MNPNQRKPEETHKEYKERLREQNSAAKGRVCRVLWDSARRGTYVKAKHGELGQEAA